MRQLSFCQADSVALLLPLISLLSLLYQQKIMRVLLRLLCLYWMACLVWGLLDGERRNSTSGSFKCVCVCMRCLCAGMWCVICLCSCCDWPAESREWFLLSGVRFCYGPEACYPCSQLFITVSSRAWPTARSVVQHLFIADYQEGKATSFK